VVAVLAPADYMDRALFLARRGLGTTSPNPVVGAVVVSPEGVVVGHGHHGRAGEAHAEVRALAMAGGLAQGSTLYCTLEPCSHWGRTGPCVDRILEAGVSRVVAAVEDPNPVVHGRGFARLAAAGVAVEVGLGAAAARAINQPYFALMQDGRPFVILKAAISLDGRLAAAPGARTRLTSAAADRHAHRIRAEVDAIGVGVGTVLADDPLLTVRGVYRSRPLVRVVFDRHLRTPPGARVLSTHDTGPVIIVTTASGAAEHADDRARLEAEGAEIEVVDQGTMREALSVLGGRRVSSLLLEGGAAIHRAAWDENVVDFVRLYVTPHLLGPGGVPFLSEREFPSSSLFERRVEPIGPDVMIEGYVHGPR
jgi:diaminohydroxyphosphoribosylaminopyrimidine deaminase/5-amino-6-(5-phosphoribosylamino)uracil reductase